MKKKKTEEDKPITLGTALFKKMVNKMHSQDDVKAVLDAYCNIVGHRNILKQSQTDAYLLRALELGFPE